MRRESELEHCGARTSAQPLSWKATIKACIPNAVDRMDPIVSGYCSRRIDKTRRRFSVAAWIRHALRVDRY